MMISDNKFVYIDFGLFGERSEQNREDLIKILDAIVFEDVDGLMNLLLQIVIVKSDVDRFVLYEDLEHFFYVYVAKDVSQIDIGILFNDILSVTHKHGLIMPNDFIMLAKSMRSEEHTSELQSRGHLVCRLLLEKKKNNNTNRYSY